MGKDKIELEGFSIGQIVKLKRANGLLKVVAFHIDGRGITCQLLDWNPLASQTAKSRTDCPLAHLELLSPEQKGKVVRILALEGSMSASRKEISNLVEDLKRGQAP